MIRSLTQIMIPLLVIFTLSQHTLAQQKDVTSEEDSLLHILKTLEQRDTVYANILIDLGKSVQYIHLNRAINYFQEGLSLSRTIGDAAIRQQILSCNNLGICFGIQNNYVESLKYFNEAVSLSKEFQHNRYLAQNYNNLGIVHKIMGDYPRSISYYHKSLSLDEVAEDSNGIASTCANLGVLLDLMKDPEQAYAYYQRSYDIRTCLGEVDRLASLNINFGLLYLDKGEYQKALTLFKDALAHFEQKQKRPSIALTKLNLGSTYAKLEQYETAERYLSEAITESDDLGAGDEQVKSRNELANIKAMLGKYDEAIRLTQRAFDMSDSLHVLPLMAHSYETLSFVHEKMGNTDQALTYFKKFKSLTDSLFNESMSHAFKNQQVIMEVGAKDREIQQQAFEVNHLNMQVRNEQRWKWMLGIISSLLLAVGLLFYQKYVQGARYTMEMEKKNWQIAQQKEEIIEVNRELERQFELRIEADNTINYFAASLFGKNTIDDILWDVAQNCMSRLGLVDCVIYLIDESRRVLVQKAAYGGKNPSGYHIESPIEIPIGEGIVGHVAETGKAELVRNTSDDPRYIIDDASRLSELAVPLKIKGKVIGVIDSEHPDKDFFTQHHLDTLRTIASICASKIAQTRADIEAEKGKLAQIEADKMRELDQMKSHFFANISHEFRTPLNLILGPLQMHDTYIPAQEVGIMRRNAERLLRLVNQLLDLAKLEVGQLQVNEMNVDLFQMLRTIVTSFSSYAASQGVQFQTLIPEFEQVVRIDPDKLEKICYNLISNAIKFTPEGGLVSVSASITAPNTLNLIVSDTGIGIAEDQQERLFDRFFQADSSKTRRIEGSGIGLTLTKELVELIGGNISFVSQEDRGSIFTIQLPLKAPLQGDDLNELNGSLTYSLYQKDHAPSIKDLRSLDTTQPEDLPIALIVEDHPDLQSYMFMHLRQFYTCLQAFDGEEGIKIAQERVPDIIISDVMMPHKDGMELAQFLKSDAKTSHIPIILLTARDDQRTKRVGFESGVDQYLAKPFDIIELKARMDALIHQRNHLREKYSKEISLQPLDIQVEDREAQFIEKLIDIVEQHLDNSEFRVEQLQKEIGMSRMQLHRKLKALTNQSASEFIRNIRLEKASQLLAQKDVHVAEAAYQVGFTHLSYFAKCFKEKFGCTPSEYYTQASPHGNKETE